MKKCYDCIHYYTDNFCGYSASRCALHGSLDVDQDKRHPDVAAEACQDYNVGPAANKAKAKSGPYSEPDYENAEKEFI